MYVNVIRIEPQDRADIERIKVCLWGMGVRRVSTLRDGQRQLSGTTWTWETNPRYR